MGLSRFYCQHELSADSSFSLDKGLAHYLRNVLRGKPGDQIILFNGHGGEFLTEIVAVQKREVSVRVIQFDPVDRESALIIHLGVSIVKRDAMDSILQKSTELGVTEIQPLIADQTTVSEKVIIQRGEHWQQRIVSACEQCGRNILPVLLPPVTSSEWIRHQTSQLKLALHPTGTHALFDALTETDSLTDLSPKDISVLIGPEGGLSQQELELAESNSFILTGLGRRILRADTAPITVLSILQARFGDLSPS
jgi:16S rRNA (uracil1498-N3)-methyltransferase